MISINCNKFDIYRLESAAILPESASYVDLMVIHLSCSSLRVSVNRVSPALAPAMIPAFDTSESVNVDLPWST